MTTPTLTSLDIYKKVPGSAQFTLTLDGTNFVAESIVSFDAIPLVTTYVSGTQLTAIVPAALLVSANVYAVTVSGLDIGPTQYQYLTFSTYTATDFMAGYVGAHTDGTSALVELLGYNWNTYSGDSRGYARFTLPGKIQSGSLFTGGGGSLAYCSASVGLNGSYTTIIGTNDGYSWTDHAVNQAIDTIQIRNHYQAADPTISGIRVYGSAETISASSNSLLFLVRLYGKVYTYGVHFL